MTTSAKTRKAAIIVLATYIFLHLQRICFTVRSSDGTTTYMTCFDNGHGACTCDGNAVWHRQCKHIKHLAPITAEKIAQMEAKQAARNVVIEAESIVTTVTEVNDSYEQWKRENGLPDQLSYEQKADLFDYHCHEIDMW